MDAQESISTKRILEHAGYECKFSDDTVVVKDPVQCYQGGGIHRTEYRDITIRSFRQADQFIAVRS